MPKLIIQYIKDMKDLLSFSTLKVKVDEDIKFEVPKGEKNEIDLKCGKHTIKYYFTGYGKNDICGYDEKELEILDGNNYFVYKTPFTLLGKGRLIRCENELDFNKKIKSSKYLKIVAFILTFIITFIICCLYL